MMKIIKVSRICDEFCLKMKGRDVEIAGLGLCNRETAKNSIMSYVTASKYVEDVKGNLAITCLVLNEDMFDIYEKEIDRKMTYIICDRPEKIFYIIHEWLCENDLLYEKCDFATIIGSKCNISDSAVIEDGVVIGDRVTIGHNTVVKSGTVIENDVVIGCNSTIGSEGFQIISDGIESPMHITHVGRCHISSYVNIGDNTCVCNSLFEGETFIGEGVKVDNLVHIAHNLYIGKNAIITAHVILCGSSRVEEGAWIAPNVSVLNRVVVGKYAKVGIGSVVTRDVKPYSTVYGCPAKEHK